MFRRVCTLLFAYGLIATFVFAQTKGSGSGPYPVILEGDPGVPGHTIYRPESLDPFNPDNSMPILAWGNGGCANSSRMHAPFLEEVASHGFLVVAIGPYSAEEPSAGGGRGGGMMMGGQTKSAQLLEALDWAKAENNRRDSKYYRKLDPSKFAAAGMSCGGLQALEVSPDPRVSTTLVMNSGLFAGGMPKMGARKTGMPQGKTPQGEAPKVRIPQGKAPQGRAPKAGGMMMAMPSLGKEHLQKLHSPVVYIDGGESDIAYQNGEDDFERIDKVPIAIAHYDDVGHGGTYTQPNGGAFGTAAVAWLKWQLNGDETAKKMFAGPDCGLCKNPEWEYKQKKIQ
jgi:hypothetical protein